MSDDRDNVIHIVFGRDGTSQRVSPPPPAPEPERPTSPPPRNTDDPLADLYSVREVARLFDLRESRLRYWDKSGFLSPSAAVNGRRYYTFQDLIGIRAARGLLDQGVPLRRVRRAVEALRTSLPRVTRPLSELRVTADEGTMLVQDEAGTYEPSTGQGVLDFRVGSLRDDVVRVLRTGPSAADRRAAYEYYLEGCRLDEDETTYDRAEAAYLRALQLDPALGNAHTNLGNLAYRRGRVEEATAHYERALGVDADQPEAHYNLGFLALDADDAERAVECFERALRVDPAFADAHFNLAMAYEQLGRSSAARPHWETYLTLEPTGTWASIAQSYLG